MKKWIAPLSVLLGLWAAAAFAADPTVVSAREERTSLDLTVYNHDLALVREARRLDLPQGLFRLEFRDVPARIDPVTLRVSSGGGFTLLEQNYEFDLMSRERILQKYVGRELAWIQEDGRTVVGKLLGMSNGPVYEVDGRIVFDVPGRISLPALPDDLRARPTLVWLADGAADGPVEVEASYLTGGLSWHADYVLDLDEAGRTAGLQAWVTVDNQSGATYENAGLRLMAGDLNRVRRAPREELVHMAADMAPTAKGFREEAAYDYHLYTLERPTTLRDRQIKQISLFEAEGVGVRRHYRVEAAGTMGGAEAKLPVTILYRFVNSRDNALGMPLPAGTVRVYGRAGDARQLVGEDRLGHTPRDEEIELTVGRAFDLVAERAVLEVERYGDRGHRATIRLTVRNRKDEDVTVELIENVGSGWQVTASSLPVRRVNARALAFDAPVAAGAETIVEYTVDIRR